MPPPSAAKPPPLSAPTINPPIVRAAPVRRVLPPPKPPPTKMSPVFIAILAVVVLGAGGYYGYLAFLKPSAVSTPLSKPAIAPKPAAPSPAAPAPANQPVSLPGQMVDKARKAVDAHTQNEVAPVNEITSEEKPPAPATPSVSANIGAVTKPPPAAAPVAAPPAPESPQTVRIDLNPADAASPEYKAFISNLKVSGVFQGEHPRVLIGGRTYEVGETVNDDLGVVFAGIDANRELVLFKDHTGTILVKKY